MKPEIALGLVSASEGFLITEKSEGFYIVEEKNVDEHVLSASISIDGGKVEVRYWMDGVYNSGTDFVEIPMERLAKLKRLCEFFSETE